MVQRYIIIWELRKDFEKKENKFVMTGQNLRDFA